MRDEVSFSSHFWPFFAASAASLDGYNRLPSSFTPPPVSVNRNLSSEQKTYTLGKLYEARKHAQGGSREQGRNESGRFTASDQSGHLRNVPKLKTGEQIAEEQDVTPSAGTAAAVGLLAFSLPG